MYAVRTMKAKWIINLVVAGYVVFGVVLMLAPTAWFPEYVAAHYLGILSFVSAAIVLVFPYLLKSTDPEKQTLAHKMHYILIVILLTNAAGELGLYQLYFTTGFQYDKVLHFLTPLLCTITLMQFFIVWYGWARARAATVAALLSILFFVLWEVWELTSDLLFGTRELGIYGAQIKADTIADVVYGLVGVGVGLLVQLDGVRRRFGRMRLTI